MINSPRLITSVATTKELAPFLDSATQTAFKALEV